MWFCSYYWKHVNAHSSGQYQIAYKTYPSKYPMRKYLWSFPFFSPKNLCVIYCISHDYFMFFFVAMSFFACVSQFLGDFYVVFVGWMTEPFKFRPLQIYILLFFPKDDWFWRYPKSEVTDIIQLWLFTKYILIYIMPYRIWTCRMPTQYWMNKKRLLERISEAINILMFVLLEIIIRIFFSLLSDIYYWLLTHSQIIANAFWLIFFAFLAI